VIDKSFGFDTAVEEAQRAINAAHVEVESVENGVGIVKLMGRYSGKLFEHRLIDGFLMAISYHYIYSYLPASFPFESCRFHCNVCNFGKSRCGKTFVG